MIPVVTPEEMKAIDASASEPAAALVERAGAAVARMAVDILGGTYGRRVVVVAGKGMNGADGRVAARRLERRGVRVQVIDAAPCPAQLPACDLVVDAAYGTGFRGAYDAPDAGDAFVLAVDVPSGLDALTGVASPGAVRADATVTFAAMKPGLVYDRARHTGLVTVVDIGLDVSSALAHLVEPADVSLPPRALDAHKYAAAVLVVAGSPGMSGAPELCARAALRSGSGYVRLAVPGAGGSTSDVVEAVGLDLPSTSWAGAVLDACDRMKSIAIGPGLGRERGTLADVKRVASEANLPMVVDGDGLRAVDPGKPMGGPAPRVLTPHEGEFEHLAGAAVGDDRLADIRRVARETGATVLLKGPTTVVADGTGGALFVTTGGPALATAGTGDVLTGMVAAFLAQGLPPLHAAAYAACAHGLAAGAHGLAAGLVASDLPDLVARVLWS
ncbi:MAG TPA: NAD(P)H-hydrate dehydratase [Acidimicrobiales bacterium]